MPRNRHIWKSRSSRESKFFFQSPQRPLDPGGPGPYPPRMDPTPNGLFDQLPSPWRALLPAEVQARLPGLEALLEEEARLGHAVCPPRPQLFAALTAVPPAGVRVVLLGQDPYPTLGVANGLAFSVRADQRLPASLKRLYEALRLDVGGEVPATGDLTGWARQGVLLLNTVLSVREGAPNSHKDRGWEDVTQALLRGLCAREAPLVFLSLGRQAEALVERLSPPERHVRIVAPHPSPLTGRRFFEAVEQTRPFSAVNAALRGLGRAPIDWGGA